jgi:hypothetical protein
MAKKVEIELDVKGNIVESTKNLRALKTELKGVAAGTAEWSKIKNDIRDIEDALESAGQSSEDFKGLLENAPGPLGMLGGAIKKVELATKSWGAAIKATGIGLLVAAIGMLVAAFSQTEGSLKKLEPLMIMLEKLFGGLVEAFQPLLEAFVEIAMKVLPVFITGVKNFYGGLMALFTLVKEAGTGVGKILKGIFTLDTDALEEGYNQLKGSWDKTKESFNQFTNNFEKGYAKQTKTQKENLDKQNEAAQKALDEKLKRMEAEDKLDEAKMEKMKAEALAIATTEQQKLDIEKAFGDKLYQLRSKDIEDKMKLYKKDSLEYKALQEQKIKLDTEYVNFTAANKTKQKDITDKSNKELLDEELQALSLKKAQAEIKEDEYQKSLYDIKKKYTTDKKELNDIEIAYEQYKTDKKKKLAEDERNIALNKLQSEINDLDTLNAKQEYDFQEDLKRLQDKRLKLDESEKLELAATELNEVERNKILQKYADLRKGIMLDEVAVAKAASEAKTQTQLAYLQALQGFGQLLLQISNGNKDLAITGLLIEKAAGLASLAINAQKNFVKDGGITSPLAWANLAVAAVGAATIVASSIKGVNDIKNAGKSSGGSGGGTEAPMAGNSAAALGQNYEKGGMIGGNRHAQGGTMIEAEAGEAIMTRGAVTAFTPLLSMMNQMGGGTSFTQGAVGQSGYDSPKIETPISQPQIIKTYVVSSEMTSEQERQARLKDLSTI